MSNGRVLHVRMVLEGSPETVALAEHQPGIQTLQLGSALTLLLDETDAATLRACAAAFDQAAEVQALLEAVKPEPYRTTLAAVDASVHTLCVPDYGTGRAS